MRYWWVNQNQTYRAEVRGSFMWSPKQNANGARNQFYENMREVSPGDVVFVLRYAHQGCRRRDRRSANRPQARFQRRRFELVARRLVRSRRLLYLEQSDPTEGSRDDSSPVPTREVLSASGERRRAPVRVPRRASPGPR